MYRIEWSEFAANQLDTIFEYYNDKINYSVSRKIILSILIDIDALELQPSIGKVEELLINRKLEYRHLVSSNYKVIYTIDDINKTVKISDVFDTRQNPIKIIRNN